MFSTLGANTPPDATTPETGEMIQKYKITKLNPFSTNASISFLLKTSKTSGPLMLSGGVKVGVYFTRTEHHSFMKF